MFADLPIKDRFRIPPHPGGTARALSRIGYDLPEALSDLIDNSIDAGASKVSIVFHRDDVRIVAITVVDNGRGMDAVKLERAMQFGVQAEHGEHDLGTFGLGLKSASLSQCRTLTVVTRRNGAVAACRWNAEAIRADWSCERLDVNAATTLIDAISDGSIDITESGTLVSWERLDRLGVGDQDVERFLSKQLDALDLYIGLHFHRFISTKRLSIVLSVQHVKTGSGLPREVAPYDPFLYRKSGERGYPKIFEAAVADLGPLRLVAHVWPAHALDPQFRLGRKMPTRFQGFYFYRNDRLIQAGGWNQFLPDTSDPDLVLARVSVDLPESIALDTVSVQKHSLQVSASLAESLEHARCGAISLRDFVNVARRVQRANVKAGVRNDSLPLVPGNGLPVKLRQSLSKLLGNDDDLDRPINFEWAPLGAKKIFEIDISDDTIMLNRRYRARILQGKRGSAADAPLVKTLIFLLLRGEFDRERQSAKQKEWIAECNSVLLRAVRAL